jgi:hypothetical protein
LAGIIILQMPEEGTLWIEFLPGATDDPATWLFTENKTIFER